MYLAVMALMAASAAPLSPAQQQEVQRLESTLMAPCCYTQTIGEHRSAEAEQMREEVEAMVAGGRTEEQVKNFYRAKYGETILVVPEGKTGKVAYGVPIALGAVALLLLITLIRRSQLRHQAQIPQQASAQTGAVAADPMIERIRRELGESS